MNDFNELFELIKRGEDQQLDFKRHITNLFKIARTIVSFANTEGGQIVIGIDDEGEIRGVDIEQERYMMIKAARHYCDPSIFLNFGTRQVRGKQVLMVAVEKSKISDHRSLDENGNWLPYVRVRDQSIVLPGIDEQLMADKKNIPIPIMMEENDGLIDYLEANESISIKDYMQMMNISYGIAKRSLKKLTESGVLEETDINNRAYFYLKDEWRH